MNGTFNGFPSVDYDRIIGTQEYDSSGTYVIPQDCTFLYVFAIGGGGGGAGGALNNANLNAGGGGGAAGGTIYHDIMFAPSLGGSGTTLNIVIGSGGAGGGGSVSAGSTGSAGQLGGTTIISILGSPGALVAVRGGGGGSGNIAGGSGGQQSPSHVLGYKASVTHTGSAGSTSASNSVFPRTRGDCCGTGGGGVSSSNVAGPGGDIYYHAYLADGFINPNLNVRTTATDALGANSGVGIKYVLGGAIASNGTSSQNHLFDRFSPGIGGTGGGGGLSANAGSGGLGYRGSGGGGGGGARTGFTAGAGGKGGDGYVAIMALR